MTEPLKVKYWRFRAWLRSRRHPLCFNPWRVRIGEWQADHGLARPASEAFAELRRRIASRQDSGFGAGNDL